MAIQDTLRTVAPQFPEYRKRLLLNAATHIDRQAARIACMERALRQIAGIAPWPADPYGEGFDCADLARAALKED